MRSTLAREQHVAERTRHRQSAIVDGFIENQSKSAVRVTGTKLRHRPVWIACDHQMPDVRMRSESTLEQSYSFRTFSRARERDPEVFSAGAMVIFEIRQQSRAGERPNIATPPPPKQRRQSATGVVRSAGANQIHGRRRGAPPADPGPPQHIVQLPLAAGTQFVSDAPSIGLLPDLTRRVD